MRKIALIFWIVLTVGCAQTVDSLYAHANRAVETEDYVAAISYYETILRQEVEHPDLYYNLGNGYYRNGRIGLAVWAYEKGVKLSPRDTDLLFNLKLVNTRVRDRIERPKTIFIIEGYHVLKRSFTLANLLMLGSGILLIAAVVYFVSTWFYIRFRSKIISTLIMLSVLIHGVALDKYWDLSGKKEGIVIPREIEVFSAPYERQDGVLFRLHEGIKVEITQSQPGWMEIHLIDGKKGWVKITDVRPL